jgi:hypothetical protein
VINLERASTNSQYYFWTFAIYWLEIVYSELKVVDIYKVLDWNNRDLFDYRFSILVKLLLFLMIIIRVLEKTLFCNNSSEFLGINS